MQPSHIKLFLLILLMLGVGGYVMYSTTPPAPRKQVEQPTASATSTPSAPNVTNVHLEKKGQAVTVSGQAKEVIDPSLTDLIVEVASPAGTMRGSFDKVTADVLVENRGLKAGTVTVDLKSLNMGSSEANQRLLAVFGTRLNQPEYTQATFVITHINRGIERGAIAVGNLTLNQITQEIQAPFVREGGGLRGSFPLTLSQFGLQLPGVETVNVRFLLGVK